MATDSAILTVAREIHAATLAVKAQEQEVVRINGELVHANRRLEELKVRLRETERRLLQMSAAKPDEVAFIVANPTKEQQDEFKKTAQEFIDSSRAKIVSLPDATLVNTGTVPQIVHKKRDRVGT